RNGDVFEKGSFSLARWQPKTAPQIPDPNPQIWDLGFGIWGSERVRLAVSHLGAASAANCLRNGDVFEKGSFSLARWQPKTAPQIPDPNPQIPSSTFGLEWSSSSPAWWRPILTVQGISTQVLQDPQSHSQD